MAAEYSKSILDNVLIERATIVIVFLALLVPLVRVFKPGLADTAYNYLIPVAITAIFLHIYLIRRDVKNIRGKIPDNFLFQSFTSGEDFDNYLANRFKKAHEVKVIHMSSGTSGKREGRRYSEILDTFVRRGGRFTRIISDSSNIDVFRWIKEDLKEYEQHKYFIHFVQEITVGEIKTIGIMIIDKDEVCLGGGYDTSFDHPTISIRHESMVKFFLDYFEYLSYKSLHVRSDVKNIKWEYLNKRIEELERPSGSLI